MRFPQIRESGKSGKVAILSKAVPQRLNREDPVGKRV
jgi:hypothetical protein